MDEAVLRTTGLTKSFRGRRVLDHLGLEVAEGEIFGFLGPNGAGKSTTIRLMLALIKPDSGDVEIFGRSVSTSKNGALRRVGALIEEPDFYRNLTAKRNLRLLANLEQIPRNRIDEVLHIVGLADRGSDKVKAYSHGMKQRLGIAQALLSKPKLLILDEPTTGLDPQGMKEVRELIVTLASEGITIFLSSHLLHEVEQVCTSMAIINRGRLIKAGKVENLLSGETSAGGTAPYVTEIRAVPLDRAKTIIDDLPFVKEVDVREDVLKVRASSHQVSEITRALIEHGVDVTAVIPRTSLEDYFLSLTGSEGIGRSDG
ncbi:MAG: ABC transporter ATP-binding protein [Fidelibacterota bacterium]